MEVTQIINENTNTNAFNLKSINPFATVKERLIDIIENMICVENQDTQTLLNDKFLNLDFASQYDIDNDKIGLIDASFFINILGTNEPINYTIDDNKITFTTNEGKTLEVTKSLLNVLNTSLVASKPVRLDFDKDVTVILKLDKKGQLQTHFIPGSLEVESYLKQNLTCLKQRFDDENINWSYMGYSKYKDENKQKQNKNKKGEN